MRRWFPVLWSQIAWLLWLGVADAAPLFDDDAILDIELRGPLRETLRDDEERAERPFVLAVDGRNIDVMVRVRGKSRVVTCRFPPLRLAFGDAAGTVFAGQGSLKLVTHCNARSRYELNVLEEFAAYRIMGLLTQSSLRVRLLRIRYVDTASARRKPVERFGFLLESERDLAERLGGKLVELPGVALGRLEREQIASVFVAQYLIGNADYSLVMADTDDRCCHNGILVEVADKLHYVPYDFDRTTLVAPVYLKSQERTRRREPPRRYVGYCMDDLDLGAAIVRARDAREQIFAEIHAIEAISGHELDKATRFLNGFFEEADDPARLAAHFEKSCLD